MNGEILMIGLLAVSILTTLTVQAIKAVLGERKYSANVLAAITSVVLSLAISIGYLIYTGMKFTPQIGVVIVALMYLSFLAATVGYDKVVQAIKQIVAK
jgi:hypothetical protein